MAMRTAAVAGAALAARTARYCLVLLAVLSLGSCQVLQFVFGSVFPSTTVLIKGQASLAAQIPSTNNTPFSVRVIETGGFGYVVVIGTLTDTGITAFFFDLNLNPKATYTGLAGNGVGVDSNGLIVVGSLLLNPDLTPHLSGSIAPVSLGSDESAGVDTFEIAVAGNNLAGWSMSGATFNYAVYNNAWANQANTGPLPLSGTISSLQIDAVLDDGGANVILVVSPSTGGNNGNNGNNVTAYFLTVAKATFSYSTLNLLLDSSPHRDNMEGRSFGFAQGSIFAYDVGSSSYVRIDPATASTQASFYSGNDPSNVQFAYRVSGGSFYGYDSKTRQLTMYSAWW
jgi:hypothetical protein